MSFNLSCHPMTAYGLQGLDWTGMKFVLFARIVVTSLDLQ